MTDHTDPAYRPTLTDDQLAKYLCRIYSADPSSASSLLESTRSKVASSPYETLKDIQAAHLRTITFDNLGIHYNPTHRLSLDAEDVFDKIVTRGRGGYCMESTGLMGCVLRTLGYELYTGGARMNEYFGGKDRERWEAGFWDGWDHMILFVTIDEATYIVDVGFGPRGPTRPIPLVTDTTVESAHNFQHRLIKVPLKAHTSSRSLIPWTLQYRDLSEPSPTWNTTYSFYEIEFLPHDYQVMNYFTSTMPGEKFVELLIVARWNWSEEEGKFVGWVFLKGDKVVRVEKGVAEEVDRYVTEEERVKGLEKWFGVKLTEEERAGIKGWSSELK